MNPTKTEAIKRFLIEKTHADLASLYNHDMEVQVNVAQDNGEHVEGDYKGRQWRGWTDGLTTWKPIRIPYKAYSEPEYQDSPIAFDLALHAEGIGMTGWDWKAKQSIWVAFDFDAISGHSERHQKKMTSEELDKLKDSVKNIEWVTLRKSTSGNGLHLYIFLEPVATCNHSEHSALARAILGYLSAKVGFDFNAKVDTCGGNMWCWHRKMSGTDGLALIKSGTKLAEIPPNWRDHIQVTRKKKTKSVPGFIEEMSKERNDVEESFLELTGQRIRTPLDEEHKKLINWLYDTFPGSSWWDSDHWMLVTHTSLLKEAHTSLALQGPFETLAQGTEKGSDHNMFAFPLPKGAWACRRYSPGVGEHPYWEQDGVGYTRCFFNRQPDLASACRVAGGVEDPKGGYHFNYADDAEKAALLLGANLNLPIHLRGRKTKVKEHNNGRLIVEIKQETGDAAVEGWLGEKNKWVKIFNIKNHSSGEPEIVNYDDEVRHLITEKGSNYGWVVRADGRWNEEPLQHVKVYMQAKGLKPNEVQNVLGACISRPWKLVNIPFREEYPGNREWNRDAAQLRFAPKEDCDDLNYPTWNKILKHCGQGLNDAVSRSVWCKANGILEGGDYLKCWIASMFQSPFEPLPYLFFHGPQDSGKSIFHEALSELITNGYVRADLALTSTGGFNGELEPGILCVVEETDFRRNTMAYNRIKDWVTGKMINIHKKREQAILVPNKTKWVHCANSHLACPIFPGDTRITMIYVPGLDPIELIPKRELLPMLIKEAPDFLADILRLEIPQSNDRLNVPVLSTEEKLSVEQANQTFLEMFIQENCHAVDGCMIQFSEFYDKFAAWVDPNYLKEWSKIKVGRELPPKFPKGRLPQTGQFWIGNISWAPANGKTEARLILKDGKLVPNE